MRLVQQEIASCSACPGLRPWRQFAREAYGTARTRYLLVGEAPGFVSWRKGRRFTGPAGLLIRRALRHIGHARYQDLEDLFYMTDVVKCHPGAAHNPDANRSPRRSERRMCQGHLLRELQVLRPAAIVTFGKAAAEGVAEALQVAAEAGGSLRPVPLLLAFPHPSPRNQTTIRQHYPSMEAFERAIAAAFRKLIRRLEKREA
jgi:uracil-DNA glycosylase